MEQGSRRHRTGTAWRSAQRSSHPNLRSIQDCLSRCSPLAAPAVQPRCSNSPGTPLIKASPLQRPQTKPAIKATLKKRRIRSGIDHMSSRTIAEVRRFLTHKIQGDPCGAAAPFRGTTGPANVASGFRASSPHRLNPSAPNHAAPNHAEPDHAAPSRAKSKAETDSNRGPKRRQNRDRKRTTT